MRNALIVIGGLRSRRSSCWAAARGVPDIPDPDRVTSIDATRNCIDEAENGLGAALSCMASLHLPHLAWHYLLTAPKNNAYSL
jgi:hypothetical protein